MTEEIRIMVATRIIELVFHELVSRAGFDHWWGEVDKETRKEIVDELIQEIAKELE